MVVAVDPLVTTNDERNCRSTSAGPTRQWNGLIRVNSITNKGNIDGGNGVAYVVDLSNTEYLDSSALGMLLLLREHAGGENANIEITQASADVRKILDVANFSKLFKF